VADHTLLGTCDENLPMSQILRQFDFGQFVFLHALPKKAVPGAANPPVPRAGDVAQQIVIDPSGGRRQFEQDWIDRMQARQNQNPRPGSLVADPPAPEMTGRLGGISLNELFAPGDVSNPVEMKIPSANLGDVIGKKQFDYGGKQYSLDISAAAANSLARGEPALVLAATSDGKAPQFMTQLTPDISNVKLDADALDHFLASGEVSIEGNVEHVAVGASESRALLAGESVVAWTKGASNAILRLSPPVAPRRPAESNVEISDLAEFLGQPQIDGADGRPIAITLNSSHVNQLRTTGLTTIAVAGTSVTVRHNQFGAAATPRLLSMGMNVVPLDNQERAKLLKDALKNAKIMPPAPTTDAGMPAGIQIAVLLPWRQTWELKGFSRGELRSSLALSPQEEMTIEVSSWERRLRTLDQSSETDVDQSFESSTTERASDDVFNEMTKHHDFNWQIEGSLNATYSTGNGSISLAAGGSVSDADQLQSIARTTHQGMKESTQKAAAKIRAVRTTHITDSIEGGSQSRVTRRIKNPNFSHTLTLDFFETLALYTVKLEARPERLTLVALLNNPMATPKFNAALVRRNEITLRRALLDSSLVDGFDACRKTRAYEMAIDIINEQTLLGAVADHAAEPSNKDVPIVNPLQTAQEKAVVELLKQIAAAYKTVNTNLTLKISGPPTQMWAIIDLAGFPMSTEHRTDAQHCLFLQLGNKYLPGLLSMISKVPAAPTIADAGALYAVIPAPGATMSLAKFADISYADKELAGLGNALAEIHGRNTMGWVNGVALAENLYSPDDAGLAGLVDTLWMAYKAYLAKQSEGEFKAEKDVAIANANATQEKLSTADKLAMAFPLDELASARERQEALISHLNAHNDHYSFALFQGLSPAEQSKYIEDSGLEVGTFEPRVLAISGPKLAVPLAPPPAGALRTMVEDLRTSFRTAFGGTVDTPDDFVFPTPGLSINSRLGECPACEDLIEDSRKIELRRLTAVANSAEHEAARRAARIAAKDLGDPLVENAPLRVMIEKPM
jgi:hypothetical protein